MPSKHGRVDVLDAEVHGPAPGGRLSDVRGRAQLRQAAGLRRGAPRHQPDAPHDRLLVPAPAIAAGNCTVLKPASPTPWSILKFAELIQDIVPAGVVNIVNGPGAEIGKALATNKRIAKIAFTGETATGRLIMQYAAQNLIPSTTELGGKSPNIFFADVMAADDEFLDKAVEGLVLYAFNKGEVCTAPRAR